MTTLIQLLLLAAPFALLERFASLRLRPARFLRAWFAGDLVYLVTGYAAGGSLALLYVAGASRLLAESFGLPRVADLGLPVAATAALALVALDLGNYLAHWLLHRSHALWEIHKVHHSSPGLDWLATFRSHLVEQALRRLVAPVFVILFGIPLPAVALAYAVFLVFAIWNHANLRLAPRWLEPLFVTPRLHRLHHLPATTERNLGTVFSLWDRMLGRLHVADAPAQARTGVPGELETYPQGWRKQLVHAPARALGRLAPRVPRPLAG